MNVQIIYYLSKKGQGKDLLFGGSGKAERARKYELDIKQMEIAIDLWGINCDGEISVQRIKNMYTHITDNCDYVEKTWIENEFGIRVAVIESQKYVDKRPEFIFFDKEPTIAAIFAICKKNNEICEESKKIYSAVCKKVKETLALKVIEEKKKVAERRKKIIDSRTATIEKLSIANNYTVSEKKDLLELIDPQDTKIFEIDKMVIEIEKHRWIKKHGSERLKKMYDMDYPHNGFYARERIESELGTGWIVDSKDNYEEKEKVAPALESMQIVEKLEKDGYRATVVWLTEPESNDYEAQEKRRGEAIKIKKYLNLYDVYLYV